MNDAATALDQTSCCPGRAEPAGHPVGRPRAAVRGGEIATELGLSQQIVSHHLRVLAAAGLVTGARSGTRHLFAVRSEGLAVGQEFFDDFWPGRLSALKRAVESPLVNERD